MRDMGYTAAAVSAAPGLGSAIRLESRHSPGWWLMAFCLLLLVRVNEVNILWCSTEVVYISNNAAIITA
jgi:hypothetical protein